MTVLRPLILTKPKIILEFILFQITKKDRSDCVKNKFCLFEFLNL